MNARSLATAAGLLGLMAGAVLAQSGIDSSVAERVRQVEQERRTGLASTESYLRTTGADRNLSGWGAWFTDTYIDFSDDDHNNRVRDSLKSLNISDARLWWATQMGPKFSSYVRAKAQNFDFGTAAGVPAPDFHILQHLDLDMGYLEYRPDVKDKVRAGRQFTQVGRGFVLADILDGAQYTRQQGQLELNLFYGTTPNRILNVDTSIIGFNQGLTHHNFGFLEAAYTHRAGNRYYAYHVSQVDHSESLNAAQAALDFRYNSSYTGIGGNIRITPRLLLLTEAALEGGSTLAATAGRRVDVEASFFEALALWQLKGANDGLVQAEYAYGSGDPQRGNVTDTFGGKRNGTTDENWLYFGRIETGLALSPRLSNLHMARVGYQQRIRLDGRNVHPTDPLIGVKFTEYYKDHQDGAISDTLASVSAKHVGGAADAYIAWRIWSDTVLNLQYGLFSPGAAYPAGTQDNTQRFLASTTLSF